MSREAEISDVIETLERIGTKVDNLVCQDEALVRLETKVDKLQVAVFGNGDLTGGIVGRILLLNKWMDNRIWFERAIIGVVLSEALAIIFVVLNREIGLGTVWTLKDHLAMLLASILQINL